MIPRLARQLMRDSILRHTSLIVLLQATVRPHLIRPR